MKAYIQTAAQHQCSNSNSFAAYDGFQQLGWETVFFREDMFVYFNHTIGDAMQDLHALNRKVER